MSSLGIRFLSSLSFVSLVPRIVLIFPGCLLMVKEGEEEEEEKGKGKHSWSGNYMKKGPVGGISSGVRLRGHSSA